MRNMLEVRDLSLRYGRHLALDKVSIRLDDGETVVILGANGAGKSSLLRAIGGLTPCFGPSEILFEGKRLVGLAPHRLPDLGLALVPEGRGVFATMSVAENLLLGTYPSHARAVRARQEALVYDLFPKLAERRRQLVGTMSGGEQQMVAIGRALMSAPRCLLLDEPSLGLAPIVVSELFEALAQVREAGVSMLLVEQNVAISLSIASRGYLMETGRIVGEDSAEALKSDPAVNAAFLGSGAGGGEVASSAVAAPLP